MKGLNVNAGGINVVRALYLLAKVWEPETVSTPGELGRSGKMEDRSGFDL